MQTLKDAIVKGNLIHIGDWEIMVYPCRDDLVFQVKHKTDGRNWIFDTLEEALEGIK